LSHNDHAPLTVAQTAAILDHLFPSLVATGARTYPAVMWAGSPIDLSFQAGDSILVMGGISLGLEALASASVQLEIPPDSPEFLALRLAIIRALAGPLTRQNLTGEEPALSLHAEFPAQSRLGA
jgi:hypothetical protein